MMDRFLKLIEDLVKDARRRVKARQRVAVPAEVWDALMDANRQVMAMSADIYYESGRVMAFQPPGKGEAPLNPKAAVWSTTINRIESTLGTAIMGLRREEPASAEQLKREERELVEMMGGDPNL